MRNGHRRWRRSPQFLAQLPPAAQLPVVPASYTLGTTEWRCRVFSSRLSPYMQNVGQSRKLSYRMPTANGRVQPAATTPDVCSAAIAAGGSTRASCCFLARSSPSPWQSFAQLKFQFRCRNRIHAVSRLSCIDLLWQCRTSERADGTSETSPSSPSPQAVAVDRLFAKTSAVTDSSRPSTDSAKS